MTQTSIQSQFRENGFYLAPGLFDREAVGLLETDFDRVVAQLVASDQDANARWQGRQMDKLDGGDSVVIHTHNIQAYSARWTAALQHTALLDAAGAILGPDIVLHHTKLFCKPPGKGAPFPMHQDWDYFPMVRDSMIAAVIHVSDATEAMGCFRVYPGSHRAGRISGLKGQGKGAHEHPDYPFEGSIPIEAHAGDVLFFHYCLVHGSGANRSRLPRKTVLVQLYAGGDEVEPGNRHSNVRLVLRGFDSAAGRAAASRLRTDTD